MMTALYGGNPSPAPRADRDVGGERPRIAHLSICGITEPIADVSATDDPEMPLRNVVATTFTADRPPRMGPSYERWRT
jgi:hypothetical protein